MCRYVSTYWHATTVEIPVAVSGFRPFVVCVLCHTAAAFTFLLELSFHFIKPIKVYTI